MVKQTDATSDFLGGSSMRLSTMVSIISCSVGTQVMWALGTPFAVMPRLKLPQESYWLVVSPMLARRCG